MNVLKVKKGETLARKQDKVMEWYLIQEGSVIRQFAFAEIIMHRNAIVGILENEWFACDYVANEDTTLIVIPCKNAQDLRKILSEHENFRPIFFAYGSGTAASGTVSVCQSAEKMHAFT